MVEQKGWMNERVYQKLREIIGNIAVFEDDRGWWATLATYPSYPYGKDEHATLWRHGPFSKKHLADQAIVQEGMCRLTANKEASR